MQHPYRCWFDWGRHGVWQASARGDILIIVDTLSFSTATVTAVHYGSSIYPCTLEDDAIALTQQIGGEVAVSRHDVPLKGRFSLSPLTYIHLEAGLRIVLRSPNGATCSRYANQVPFLFAGALVNAKGVASVVSSLMERQELGVTVIACGERWESPTEDGILRFALEDYLGAGAILSYLPQAKSPEARVCEGAFMHARDNIYTALWECESGRELREKGFGRDVEHAARINVYETVPHMRGNHFEAFNAHL